ncbi:MAG: hypothetical protein EZS28_032452 [Streblomastix strix]|uniref:Uncharacterized protein n=1 Tax=Streblomastix strix TaxID=222440 RepID=A0A5J4UPQ6_9EUKA|nr:MAG: hypothetical protein EZS28_032452 [Streblomastix strix]
MIIEPKKKNPIKAELITNIHLYLFYPPRRLYIIPSTPITISHIEFRSQKIVRKTKPYMGKYTPSDVMND